MSVCRFDTITYGDYVFNGITKYSSNITPVLADDGFNVKYNKITFECEFVLTYETVVVPDPIGGGVDLNMDAIRAALSAPGKNLSISYRGLGTDIGGMANGPGINIDTTANNYSLMQGPFPEVINWEPIVGNRAVRCTWRVSFNVPRCYLSYDSQKITSVVGPSRDLLQSFAEDQELNIDENGAVVATLQGYIEFAVLRNPHKATGENTNFAPTTRETLRKLAALFETTIPLGFERKSKFKFMKDARTVTYTITDTEIQSDNPIFPYMIRADVTHEVSSSLFGDNGKSVTDAGGFFTWMNVFNGTFTVRPGVWKGWAWIAFLVYLYNRRNRASDLIGSVDDFMKDAKNAVKKSVNGKIFHKPRQFPISLRFKEHLTSRQVDINMKYVVLCSLYQLFDATGLFFPIDLLWNKKAKRTVTDGKSTVTTQLTQFPFDIGTTPLSPTTHAADGVAPLTRDEQWGWFRQLSQTYQNIYGYRNLQLPNSTLLYDPCGGVNNAMYFSNSRKTPVGGLTPNSILDPFRPPPYSEGESTKEAIGYPKYNPSNSLDPLKGDYGKSAYLNNVDPKDTWVTRKDSLVLIEDTNASMLPSLQPIGSQHLIGATASNRGVTADRNSAGFTINGRTTKLDESLYSNHLPSAYGAPTYYVRSTGYAVRLGYGIQCPSLLGIYKSPSSITNQLNDNDDIGSLIPATRIGVNKWSHNQIAQSVDIPVFLAMWDVTYALKGDVTSEDILYSTNSASQYA